jgi:transcriptional regulator with XRE-family HTH domain
MDLGHAIKTLRAQKGATQKEIAAKAGLSANALCSIEKNEAWPTKATIQAISEALGVPISCLLFASITDEDVPEKNRAIFNALKQPILDLF